MNTKIESCRYAPGGKVERTDFTDPPKQEKRRGIWGRIAAKTTQEMKEEFEISAALVQSYVQPTAEKVEKSIHDGKVSVSQAGPGKFALTFPDYNLDGDALTPLFDPEVKALQEVNVDTWL